MPELTYNDVQHIPVSGFTAIKKYTAALYDEAPDRTQIICSTNKMADTINELCAASKNRKRLRIFVEDFDQYIDTDFSLDDKVMCCKNLYDFDVMNGSVGEVIKVYKEMMLVTLSNGKEISEFPSFGQIMWDDGVEREISIEMIEALKLAYAITIQKSQGSQFERVVICYQQCKNDPLQQLKSDPVNLTLVLFGKHHDFKRRVHENKSLSHARHVSTSHC